MPEEEGELVQRTVYKDAHGFFALGNEGERVQLDGRTLRSRSPMGRFERNAHNPDVCPCCLRPMPKSKTTLVVSTHTGAKVLPGGRPLKDDSDRHHWRHDVRKLVPHVLTEADVLRLQTAFAAGMGYYDACATIAWHGQFPGLRECLEMTRTPAAPDGWTLRRQLVPSGRQTKIYKNSVILPPAHLREINAHLWKGIASNRDIAALMTQKHSAEYASAYDGERGLRAALARSGWDIQWIVLPKHIPQPERNMHLPGRSR